MDCKYSYRFTAKAEQDLDEILHYISVDLANPIAAQSFARTLFKKIDFVRSFPDACAPIDNEFLSDKTVRKLPVDNYILYYKAIHDEKIVCIIRIAYGKRNLDEILKTM